MDNISYRNISETKKVMNLTLKLKQHGVNVPLLLWGTHGIGKTQCVEQSAHAMGYDLKVINLANLTIEDFLGQIDGKGGYHRPSWMNPDHTKKTVYFLDEINRGAKYMLQGTLNLINEGRLHTHHIGKEDLVVSACNPSDLYEVTCFEDPAFLSRFAHIKIKPEQKEFMEYLNGSSIKNTIVQQTLKKSPLLYHIEDFSIGFPVKLDNRKMEKVARMFDILSHDEWEKGGFLLLESMVGFEACAQMLEVWRENNKKTFEVKDILEGNGEFSFTDTDIDIINNINVKLVKHLQDTKFKMNKKHQDNFMVYLKFIPRDLQVSLASQLFKIDNEKTIKLIGMDYLLDLIGEKA